MPERSGIFYTDQGQGFPIVLIHGFCETHEIWQSFSRELSKHYRVICFDLPGFGNSKLLPDGFSIVDVATHVQKFLTDLRVHSCAVIGHSLGGYVTLELVNRSPRLVKAFGLFHSTAYPDTDEKRISRNKVVEFVTSHGVTPFTSSFIPPLFFDQSNPHIPEVVKLASKTPLETLISYTKAMRDRFARTDVLANFTGPILFLAGEKDTGISPDSVRKQADLAKNPTLHIIENVAHMGMFEKEEPTLSLVNDFLLVSKNDFP